ncbi:Metacaspase-1 [Diplonema papillatum]|nr:Metacaspase-1 [Diplonema papillatum]
MGDVLSIVEDCIGCASAEEAAATAGLAAAGIVGVAGGAAALREVLGGVRPSLRYRNRRLRHFTPEPVRLPRMAAAGVEDKRFALLVGINYTGSKYELDGCVNDVLRMATWLSSKGYNVLCFTDADNADPQYIPTKENIIIGLRSLLSEVEDSHGNALWLHFSGHGSQVKDKSVDGGLDETICPLGFDREPGGMITGRELREEFLVRVPEGNRLLAVFDCCHSGTVLDLPYYVINDDPTKGRAAFAFVGDQFSSRNDDVRCDALLLSGCADAEKSADVTDVGSAFVELQHLETQGAGGALTSALLHTFETKGTYISIGRVLASVTRALHEKGFPQVPQLSASKPYHMRSKLTV